MNALFERLALLLVGLAFASCASTGDSFTERPRLPFHVAVIPLVVESLPAPEPVDPESGEEAPTGQALDLELALKSGRSSDRLVEALRHAFVEVSLLEGGTTDEAWVAEAERCEADLIIKGTLEYQPNVRSELNNRIYYNFPLFLLGGPVSWFVADRDYMLVNDLRVDLYDMSLLRRSADYGGARIGDRIALIGANTSRLKETALPFSRRGLGVTSILTSFIVPAGFVAKDNEAVSESLGDNILNALCEDASAAMHDSASEHLLNSTLFDFYPVIEYQDTGREAPGAEHLDLSLRLVGDEISELSRYEVSVGSKVTPERFKDGTYRVVLPKDEQGRLEQGRLRVRVIDASARQNVRTFTLRSKKREGSDAAVLTGATADFE